MGQRSCCSWVMLVLRLALGRQAVCGAGWSGWAPGAAARTPEEGFLELLDQ